MYFYPILVVISFYISQTTKMDTPSANVSYATKTKLLKEEGREREGREVGHLPF
jgi:hypothetical protein